MVPDRIGRPAGALNPAARYELRSTSRDREPPFERQWFQPAPRTDRTAVLAAAPAARALCILLRGVRGKLHQRGDLPPAGRHERDLTAEPLPDLRGAAEVLSRELADSGILHRSR